MHRINLEYRSLRENSTSILDRYKAIGSYRNMKGCILDANFEGQGWSLRLLTILVILTWELRYPEKEGLAEKEGGGEFWKLFYLGGRQMIYLGEGRVCLEDQG